MTYDERINKAIEFYKEAADEDPFAQYRYRIYLLERMGMIVFAIFDYQPTRDAGMGYMSTADILMVI